MAIVSRNNNYVFFHIPKCGGTSMSDVLPNKEIVKNIQNTHFTYFETKYAFDVNGETDIFNKAKKFSIIRNPIERTISLYRYIMDKPNHPLHNKFINKDLTQFCYYLKNIGDSSILSCKAHLSDENGKVDDSIRIFKLEEINNHLEELSDIIGTKVDKFPHVNKSEHIYTYTEECELLIKDVFSDDFEKFYKELI
jgi:hypothetical protein